MSRELQPHVLYAASSRTTRRFAFNNLSASARGARRYVVLAARIIFAVVIVSVISTAAAFAYLYSHYSKVVDARLASGYLTSRAGLYAAPRTLREGQGMTAERLTEVLRRAGYVEGEASRVWNGSFKVEDGAVEIFPSDSPGAADPGTASVVRVEFDRRGRVSRIRGDGAPLDSYTLAPEPLTVDAFEKTS